ncbi:hypothetical protein ASG82_10095 [Mycobacterium sp. Soil538]|nr:hypothetical protein ASG82_10095 [Mycobacterium sp. Soil538]
MVDIVTGRTAVPVLLRNPAVPVIVGRALAMLAAVCLIAHIPLIASHLTLAPITSVVMALVSLACIPCARRLWSKPATQDCAVAATLAATMVGLHLFLAISMATPHRVPPLPSGPMPGHNHGIDMSMMNAGHAVMPTADMQPMTMTPVLETAFYLATGAATLQVLLSGLTLGITVRRLKAS